eukprot:ctg_63.g15
MDRRLVRAHPAAQHLSHPPGGTADVRLHHRRGQLHTVPAPAGAVFRGGGDVFCEPAAEEKVRHRGRAPGAVRRLSHVAAGGRLAASPFHGRRPTGRGRRGHVRRAAQHRALCRLRGSVPERARHDPVVRGDEAAACTGLKRSHQHHVLAFEQQSANGVGGRAGSRCALRRHRPAPSSCTRRNRAVAPVACSFDFRRATLRRGRPTAEASRAGARVTAGQWGCPSDRSFRTPLAEGRAPVALTSPRAIAVATPARESSSMRIS